MKQFPNVIDENSINLDDKAIAALQYERDRLRTLDTTNSVVAMVLEKIEHILERNLR